MTTIYHYDSVTGRLLGESTATESPRQPGVPLVPAFASVQEPPRVPTGYVATWIADAWELQKIQPTQPEPVIEPAAPTYEERVEQLKKAVQRRLDAQAQLMGYDSIFTAATYAEEPAVAKFQVEGIALRAWRSAVWATCYDILDNAAANALPNPTITELLAELPAFPGVQGIEA